MSINNETFKSIKITEEMKKDVLEHPERYINCPLKVRMGKFYTDEEYEKRAEKVLNSPLPGDEYVKEKEYVEYFHNPEFSVYDFLILFSAVNATQGKLSFYRDTLIKYISICKESTEFEELLAEINLKNNGINIYSDEFDDAIFQLKIANILYTVSPEKDSEIFIFDDIPKSEIIDKRKKYTNEIIEFINKYNSFEKNVSEQNTGFVKKMQLK